MNKFKSVDTNTQPFFSFFERKAGNIPLSRRTLLHAFHCIERPFLSATIKKNEIKAVFTVVNYLQPRKEKALKKNLHNELKR